MALVDLLLVLAFLNVCGAFSLFGLQLLRASFCLASLTSCSRFPAKLCVHAAVLLALLSVGFCLYSSWCRVGLF